MTENEISEAVVAFKKYWRQKDSVVKTADEIAFSKRCNTEVPSEYYIAMDFFAGFVAGKDVV